MLYSVLLCKVLSNLFQIDLLLKYIINLVTLNLGWFSVMWMLYFSLCSLFSKLLIRNGLIKLKFLTNYHILIIPLISNAFNNITWIYAHKKCWSLNINILGMGILCRMMMILSTLQLFKFAVLLLLKIIHFWKIRISWTGY